MRRCSITVDVDRDVNQAVAGKVCAISMEKDGSTEPRFSSSAKGLEVIVDVLNGLDVQGTFFFEARTAIEISKVIDLPSLMRGHEVACHGYDHEDLTGQKTGSPLGPGELDDILERSISVVRELFGVSRMGFRAPYLSCDDLVEKELVKKDFIYDSSKVTSLSNGVIGPFITENGIVEVPVASGTDADGKKIVGYLWPMHEGKRKVGDYIHLMGQFEDGLLVFATHSWHMVENFCSGLLCATDSRAQRDNLHELISKGMDMGLEFVRVDDHLFEHGPRAL
ncbi:MAG: polysaccharide deacetylase family protein [Methanomassiliicoccales archaeon]|nr:MAG: polysaccharide deacetylase family protein [Methanomassiliicoccales archaeon]